MVDNRRDAKTREGAGDGMRWTDEGRRSSLSLQTDGSIVATVAVTAMMMMIIIIIITVITTVEADTAKKEGGQ